MKRLHKAFILPYTLDNGYHGIVDLDSCIAAYCYTVPKSNSEKIDLIKIIYSGGAEINGKVCSPR